MSDCTDTLEELVIELLYLAGDCDDRRTSAAMRNAACALQIIIDAFRRTALTRMN